MRFLKDPEPVVYEDRLHCMVRFDPVPDGVAYNDSDPFSPYYFCPEGMGFNIVYGDIVELLNGFTTSEVGEIRKLIVKSLDDAKLEYRSYIEEALPGLSADEYDGAAKMIRENRRPELLRMFPPSDMKLANGKEVLEAHLWAVYALEEFKLALDFASIPPFADDRESLSKSGYIEDMLDLEFPLRMPKPTKYARAVRAIGRQKSNMMDAATRLVFATKHLQYALVLLHSNQIQKDREALRAVKDSRMKGLNEINRLKDEAAKQALKLASTIWNKDFDKKIRIGDMADLVYRKLADQGFGLALPGTSDRLKEWIKPVAPDYARKGGRRKKTS
ncbi:hypothetical protein [Pseudomonas kurunegalensis]|uniref:Uncharacterized protein n=1 Tax=Pseudomonas kurunegalensis TaxID=485880 RepID=A0ACC5UPM0_9PSED|nr:hypothetical protein [Pseudomonas kurunegalensis]MBV4516393.1 hypothetical protein [Pseudomonas kurunegalensis]